MKRSWRSWLWRAPLDQEVDEEIAFHLEMRVRELVDRGMDPIAARFYEKRGWHRTATVAYSADTTSGHFKLQVWRYEKLLIPAAG